MQLPDWIHKYKEPHTEIKRIKKGFYKYEIAFVYSREKKKTVKKTIRLLGKITEKEGFIPSSKNALWRNNEELPRADIKTFGVFHLYSDLIREEISSLQACFGHVEAERLLCFTMMRWAYQTSIKQASDYHSNDFCSEQWPARMVSEKIISLTLNYFGENREKVVEWMNTRLTGMDENDRNFILMESTHTLSVSDKLAIAVKSHQPDVNFEKQIRLMYLISAHMKQPVYYRHIDSDITDVKSMLLCIKEINIRDKAVFVADPGFFSAGNIALMEEEKLLYIIPLHRNNSLIDYLPLQRSHFKMEMQHFIYEERIIWYYSYQKGDYRLVTFLDEILRVNEEKDFLLLINTQPETHSKKGFDKKLYHFGTLTMVYNIDNPQTRPNRKKKNEKEKPVEQTVYETYKQHSEIEVMFDSYRNYPDADVSHMQNRQVMEGWLFANFIAMIAYYKLHLRLRQSKLLSVYSPKDIIEFSKSIYKMKIQGGWHRSEISAKFIRLFNKIGIDY